MDHLNLARGARTDADRVVELGIAAEYFISTNGKDGQGITEFHIDFVFAPHGFSEQIMQTTRHL